MRESLLTFLFRTLTHILALCISIKTSLTGFECLESWHGSFAKKLNVKRRLARRPAARGLRVTRHGDRNKMPGLRFTQRNAEARATQKMK